MHAEANERIVVRSYQRGDEAAILELFARSFHIPRTIEHWRWKYQQNPFGAERISLAFVDGRLVGHYSGYPIPFRLDGTEIVAHQIGDTMTDPSVRHMGRGPTSVLGRAALHFYATFCEGKVAFNYGFNVANIQKFSLRFLRSERVEPVTYRSRDVARHPFARLSRIERYARGIQLKLAPEAGKEFDELFNRVERAYGFLVRCDTRYLNWRYFQCPDVPYVVVAIRKWGRLVAWLVFRIRERRLTIGDLLLDPRDTDVLEVALRHLTHVYPVDMIDGWFPPRPAWLDAVLKGVGFEITPEPQDLSVMCVPFELPDAVEQMRDHLYFTTGSSDLF
jgi:GNAT acetyltransferase-like protein